MLVAVVPDGRMQEVGAEWAFRLVREPRRLAKRYVVQGPRALWELRTNSHTADPNPLADRST